MSTAMRSPSACYIGVPMWVWKTLGAPVCLMAIAAVVGWGRWMHSQIDSVSETVLSHGSQLDYQGKTLDRIEKKLDHLVDRQEGLR